MRKSPIFADRKTRFNLLGVLLLLAGWGTALLLYLTSEDVSDNDLIYQLHHTPQYRRELQIIGGQMNVLADDLSLWFEGLWQGRSLARTLAALTVIVSAGFFLVAYRLPAGPRSGA